MLYVHQQQVPRAAWAAYAEGPPSGGAARRLRELGLSARRPTAA
jgi:hypothetical protein